MPSSFLYTHAAASSGRQCLFWLQFLLHPQIGIFCFHTRTTVDVLVKYSSITPTPSKLCILSSKHYAHARLGPVFQFHQHTTHARTHNHTNTQVPATLAYSFLRPNFSHTVVGIAYTGSMVLKPGKPSSDKPANPKYVWNISAIFPGRSEMPPSS